MIKIINQKIICRAIVLVGLFMSLLVVQVHAAVNNSSITLKRDPGAERFTLTIKDPDGIQEFSLKPVTQFRYGAGLSNCPKTFSITEVTFIDPVDFVPTMPAYVVDCKNNTENLEIAPPKNNLAKSTPVIEKETPSPSAPIPAEEPKKEEPKKEEKAGPPSGEARPNGGPLSASDISYPVRELGGCQDEAACRSYCDNSQRAKECFAFAKKYNLISEKQAAEAKEKFLEVTKGPGGCNSGTSCETYCNNVDHLDECIEFAEKSGYYSGDELAEAKKFQELVKSGAQFPGGCKDRNTCEVYCSDSHHMEECLNFAEKNGVIPKEELEEARKVLPFMQRGETPGGCTSKEQCEAYCSEDVHGEECVAFGEKAGLISPEDAAVIKKTGGKGPGNCHSKQQCEAYCENNSDECFKWAQDNGLIQEGDLEKMKNGMAHFKENLDKMPPEVTQCLKDAVGEKNFEKLVDGKPIFDRSMEGKMKSCFSEITAQFSKQLNTLPPEATQCIKDIIGEEKFKKLQNGEFDQDFQADDMEECFQKIQGGFGGGPGDQGGGGGFSGPGGCKSIDECTAYCQSNPQECQQFAPPGGDGGGPQGGFPGGQGGFGGPGGCKSQKECMAYCKDHPDECKNFMPSSSGGGATGSDGFTSCGIVEGASAAFVCAINGKGAEPGVETTYFNKCHAKNHGAEIVHEGFCKGHNPCSSVAHPVCGTDGGQYTDVCVAKEHGADVKHMGICTNEDHGSGNGSGDNSFGNGGGGFQGGPGGCKSQEECMAYCQSHYSDPACGGGNAPTPFPQTQSCVQPPSGLVSWWNDGVSDSVGGNNATLIGNISVVGKGAFQIGDGGYAKIGNPANLNFGTGPFSLEAWFNWDGGGGTSANTIIRKSNYPVSGSGSGYWLRTGNAVTNEINGPTLEFFVGETVGTPENAPRGRIQVAIKTNGWYHAIGTRDEAGAMRLYVNGELAGTLEAAGANTTSDAPFTIGAWDDRFGVTESFHGTIDEVSVYNRALSASEVKAVFNAGDAGKCSGSSSLGASSSPPVQSPYPQSSGQIPQDSCSSFASVPKCEYVGSPDSQNYKYCKQCFPDK